MHSKFYTSSLLEQLAIDSTDSSNLTNFHKTIQLEKQKQKQEKTQKFN